MARRKPVTLLTGKYKLLPSGDTVEGSNYFYNNTSLKENPSVLIWTHQLTTDSNSRITCYITSNGLASGTPLLSGIYSIHATPIRVLSVNTQSTMPSIESISGDFKTVIIRLGQNAVGFPGAGIPIFVTVYGNKAS